MDDKKATLLIIRNDENNVKSFCFNLHFLKYFRRYLVGSVFAVLLTLAVFILLIANIRSINSENHELSTELATIKDEVHLIDSLKLEQKLVNINENLDMIKNYFISRGVINYISAGGEANLLKKQYYAQIDVLEDRSVVFRNTLQNIPIGVPYKGRISSIYGYRPNPFGGSSTEFHNGIDFKGNIGDPVRATGDGTVGSCDWDGGYGNAVVIKHVHGYSTVYGHLSKVNVTPGQEVKAGDVVGFLGSTGRSTGPHLHYEIRRDGIDIDPVLFLKIN